MPRIDAMSDYIWKIMTVTDMVAVPLYAFILSELCRPGTVRIKNIIIHELPFVVLPTLFIITGDNIFYLADVVWAAIYGIGYAVWGILAIPRYHRRLKERFSYDENINLKWLRIILISFFVILTIWIIDCIFAVADIEILYMTGALTIWIFICYFIYKHESVIDELVTGPQQSKIVEPEDISYSSTDLHRRIQHLFEEEKIFLNPQLRLSDVASMTNSNRTYISRFFNNSHGKTFFEFVNGYRVRYAMQLLKTSTECIEIIAEQSGFNSRQSFHRVFSKMVNCTPEQFRSRQ